MLRAQTGPDDETLVWSTTDGQNGSRGGCLSQGVLWVCSGNRLMGYDAIHGTTVHAFHQFGLGTDPWLVQPYGRGLVVACGDGRLYFVDVGSGAIQVVGSTGALRWMAAQRGSLYAVGDEGAFRLPPPPDGQPFGTLEPFRNLGPIDGASIDERYLYCFARGRESVDALALDRLALLWSVRTNGLLAAPASSNGTALAFATRNQGGDTVVCVNAATKAPKWQVALQTRVTGQVLADSKYCYVPCENGQLYVLDVLTGARVAAVGLEGGQPTGPTLLGHDVVYLADGGHVYTVAMGSWNVEALGASSPRLLGLLDDVLYFATPHDARAVLLVDAVKDFYAESILIQDLSFSSGAREPDKTPCFHTEITLYDEHGSARPHQQVRIWAEAPTTVEIEGVKHPVGTEALGPFVTATTDGAGKLRLVSPAGSDDEGGVFRAAFNTPGLVIWATFMDPDLRMVVHPDAQVQKKLGEIRAEDLTAAKGYDGQPLLAPEYRDAADTLGAATLAINSAANMVKGSVGKGRRAPIRYMAPGADAWTISCCNTGDYARSVMCHEAFAFDLTLGASSFALPDQAGIARWIASHPTAPGARSVADLWDGFKRGTTKLVNALVYAADELGEQVHALVTAVIDGVRSTVDLVLDTIEHAMLLVGAVFAAIAGAVERAIEALSFLFEWPHILEVHRKISQMVLDGLHQITAPTTDLSALSGEIAQYLGNAKHAADQAFADLKQAMGSTSPQSQDDDAHDGQPATGGARDHWLRGKVQTHMLSPGAFAGGGGGGARAHGDVLVLPELTLPPAVVAKVDTMLAQLGTAVSADVQATIDRIRADLHFGSVGQALTTALSVLVDVIQGAADVAIDVLTAVVTGMLDVLVALVQSSALETYLRSKVTIPFVSAFYGWITDGSELTILDVLSLLVAVPAALLEKLEGKNLFPDAHEVRGGRDAGVSPGALTGSSGYDVATWDIVGGMSQALFGALGALLGGVRFAFRGTEEPPQLGRARVWLAAGLGLYTRVLLLGGIVAAGGAQVRSNLALWTLPTCTVVVDASTLATGRPGASDEMIRTVLSCVTGAGEILLMLATSADWNGWSSIAFPSLVSAGLILRGFGMAAGAVALVGYVAAPAAVGVSGGVKIVAGISEM